MYWIFSARPSSIFSALKLNLFVDNLALWQRFPIPAGTLAANLDLAFDRLPRVAALAVDQLGQTTEQERQGAGHVQCRLHGDR